MSKPVTHYRKDYKPSAFLIDTVELCFKLEPHQTRVISKLKFKVNEKQTPADSLFLNGENLKLIHIAINGKQLNSDRFTLSEEGLTLNDLPSEFLLETEVEIDPADNKALEGLYVSSNKFCTQCEAEGFRRITYFLDRPDIMATYSVRIEANRKDYPFLLSNGNKVKQGDLENGKHFVEWHDPFPKPSYLFALVAGDFDLRQSEFITQSGRRVALELFVDKGKLDQTEFAMQSLIAAMKWDEQTHNLEYDLDLYMIVAVGDFNMGAMENKGLNIFNTKYVLANPKTATDKDFEGVESVIGHEYFHNWTGNRVTCQDWFQLSLKEGLTVFRDQQFTSDLRSAAVKRIDDVKMIKSYQFAEDAGPMAHPIRPDEYIEMNNFYTVTVYNKGAEVIRMLHTLLGEQGYRKGMALYFKRHDGQAVTCDDFVNAMFDANSVDYPVFRNWYSQAGTPELAVNYEYDSAAKSLTLKLTQSGHHCSAVNPFLIPITLGFIGQTGESLSFSLNGESYEETTIIFEREEQTFIFDDVSEKPILSLLRNFSAPVKLNLKQSERELALLFAKDPNSYNRWDAGQRLMSLYLQTGNQNLISFIIEGFKSIINDDSVDNAFKARALSLPDYTAVLESLVDLSVDDLISRYRLLQNLISSELVQEWINIYNQFHAAGETELGATRIADRSLKNLALQYLNDADRSSEYIAYEQYKQANLMTDQLTALKCLVHYSEDKNHASEQFVTQWKNEALVMDKWFMVQATKDDDNVITDIKELFSHPQYDEKNPNKIRALITSFAALNFPQFHRADGQGYHLVVDAIKRIGRYNGQIAAGLTKQFNVVGKLDEKRKALVKELFKELIEDKALAKDVFEVASKTYELLNR